MEQFKNLKRLADDFQNLVTKQKWLIVLAFIVLNILISFKGRGGIVLFSNLFFGASLIFIAALFVLDKNQEKKTHFISGILGLFLLLFLISFSFAINRGYGLAELVLYTGGVILCWYIAQTKFNNPSKSTKQLGAMLSLIITLSILIGIYIYIYFPYDRFSSFFYNFEDKFIGYPNALADFLMLGLPLAALLKNKWLKIGAISLILIATFLTFSRGAYLSLGLGFFLAMIIFKNKINRKNILMIGIIAAISIVSILTINMLRESQYEVVNLENKVTFTADEQQSSFGDRKEFFTKSIAIMQDFPLFGVGSDGFQFTYPQYQTVPFSTSNHPHNIFLKIGVENGVATMLVFIVFWIGILILGLKSKEEHKKLAALGIAMVLAHNMIDYNLNFVPNIMLLFVLAGIVINGESSKASNKSNWPRMAAVILSIFIAIISLHETYYNYKFQQGRAELGNGNYESAEELLKESKSLIFPRKLYSSIGELNIKKKELKKAETAFEQSFIINPFDAHAANSASEVDYMINDNRPTQWAEVMAKLALKRDAQNFLRFHYTYLLTKNKITQEDRQIYQKKLQDFIPTIQSNQHNIILTDNPKYAIKIAELLLSQEESSELREILETLKNLKALEEKKFINKFGDKFERIFNESSENTLEQK